VSKHDSGRSRWVRPLRRGNRTESIKRRVVRVALIPSIALILLWLAAALYLGGTGFYDQQVASSVRQVSIPAVKGLSSVERERQLSMAYLAHRQSGLQSLLAQQKQSDQGLSAMRAAAGSALARAPQSIVNRMNTLVGFIDRLPNIRGRIDAGIATTAEVSTFYDNLLDSATDLFGNQARIVPDASVVPGAIAATNVFHISDLASRAGSLISGALAAGKLDEADYLQFTNLVGAYHALLDTTAPDLRPAVQDSYRTLTGTKEWHGLVAAENALITRGPWPNGVPADLGITAASWENLTNRVNSGLANLTITQADQVSAQALADGNQQLTELVIALALALLVVIGSIWWARRQSAVLVDNALVTRLTRLRQDAQDLVGARLPAMVSRLRAGETVNTEDQLPDLRYGAGDEIDQVATAISTALRQAVTAAAGEAQARNALSTVFRGIARRNQSPLYNLLSLLDALEQSEQDSASLERLYRLDHEATRARRNSENLIILSGGDLGQHLPGPVRMREVLRSAISETHEYQRVKLKGVVPDVAIASDAVTGLIHLIAELLENAARFSPPSYEVLVRCMPAQAGVIVEVEDRGLGIAADRRERVNTMLADPPEVDVMAIGDGSQLGFWVIASLVKRFGFKVVLRESDYGGVLAIIRVPNRLVVTDAAPDSPTSSGDGIRNGVSHRLSDTFPPLLPADTRDAERFPETQTEVTTVIPRVVVAAAIPASAQTELTTRNGSGNNGTNGNGHNGSGAGDDIVRSRRSSAAERWFTAPAEATPGDRSPGWPSGGEAEQSTKSPLPQRSPGDHLNPRLADEEASEQEPLDGDTGADVPGRDVGSALSAFQHGSEAGRRAGDS
jgi:signal transduction histidine kinase